MKRVLFILCVIFCVLAQSLAAQENLAERQVLIMFKPGKVTLPSGSDRISISEARLSVNARARLTDVGVTEVGKALPAFRREDTLKVLDDGRIFRVPDYTNLVIVTLPSGNERDSLIKRLKLLEDDIVYAEKNQIAELRGERVPRDQHFGRQWGMKNEGTALQGSGTPGADIKATFAWDITTGSNNVKLGIIDGGVSVNHPDFTNRVSGYSYSSIHGTHVAGIMGATGDNPNGYGGWLGVAGMDWNAQIISGQLGDVPTAIQSLNNLVANGCKAINNSWGFQNYSQSAYDAFRSAYQAGVSLVVANPETGVEGEYPNSFGPWILNVGATTNTDAKAFYSFDRPYTDVGAPGGSAQGALENDIYSTVPGSSYDYNPGTSMAAPHVTGTIGLLLAANPILKNNDVEQILKRTAHLYPNWEPGRGNGRINAYAALQRVVAPYTVTKANAQFIKHYENFQMIFLADPAPNLAEGSYIVDYWELKATASGLTYAQTPWAWLSVSEAGFSSSNPNNASRFMQNDVTASSINLRTYFYFIKTHVSTGQVINQWVPFDPTVITGPQQYTIVGIKPPVAPVATPATNVTSTSFTANWQVASGATNYRLDVSTNSSFSSFVSGYNNLSVGNVTSKSVTGLTAGTQYWYRVRAENSGGVSPNSNVIGLLQVTMSGPTSVYHADPKGTPPNCYTWTANVTGGAPPYSYVWSWPASGTNSSYSECYSWNGYGGGSSQYTFRVDVTDSQNSTAFATKNVTVYNSGGEIEPALREDGISAVVVPEEFGLSQNYPNPFNPETEISFALPEIATVKLTIVDVLGREVLTLQDGQMNPGYHRVKWTGRNAHGEQAGTGMYFYRFHAVGESGKEYTKTAKMLLAK